jgi:hypothetical protein
MSHGTDKKGEASRIDRFRSRYPVSSCAKLRKSQKGKLKLIGGQIEEVVMRKIDVLVLKKQQGQTTFIIRCRQASTTRHHTPPNGPTAPSEAAGCQHHHARSQSTRLFSSFMVKPGAKHCWSGEEACANCCPSKSIGPDRSQPQPTASSPTASTSHCGHCSTAARPSDKSTIEKNHHCHRAIQAFLGDARGQRRERTTRRGGYRGDGDEDPLAWRRHVKVEER